MLTSRDAAPESYQVQPESLEPFKPFYRLSNASSKVKNKNDANRNEIADDFDKRRISQPKTQ